MCMFDGGYYGIDFFFKTCVHVHLLNSGRVVIMIINKRFFFVGYMILLIVLMCSLCVCSLIILHDNMRYNVHRYNTIHSKRIQICWYCICLGDIWSPLGSTLEESISLSHIHPQDITLNGSSSSLDSSASPGCSEYASPFRHSLWALTDPSMSRLPVWLCGQMHYVVSSGCCRSVCHEIGTAGALCDL